MKQLQALIGPELGRALDIDVDDIPADANLIEYGVHSLVILCCVDALRRDGVEVDYADLARRPTLGHWHELWIERRSMSPACLAGV